LCPRNIRGISAPEYPNWNTWRSIQSALSGRDYEQGRLRFCYRTGHIGNPGFACQGVPVLNIYRLGMYESPTTDRILTMKSVQYAHFSALGTWSPSASGVCNRCGAHGQDLIEPLLVQWEPSTEVMGDFSWDGPFGYVCVVKSAVADYFRKNAFRCSFLNAEYVPSESCPRRTRCVRYPYDGPRHFWLRCEDFVDLDPTASGGVTKTMCLLCGRVRYTFRNENIVIRRKDWHGRKMFRISTNGKSLVTFVSEEGKQAIQMQMFSNVAFTRAGEIVD
jgi:hypothetical protein